MAKWNEAVGETVSDEEFLDKVKDIYQKLSLNENSFLTMEQLSELHLKQTQNLQEEITNSLLYH